METLFMYGFNVEEFILEEVDLEEDSFKLLLQKLIF